MNLLFTRARALEYLTSIRVLRGIAASGVVFHHAARAAIFEWPQAQPHSGTIVPPWLVELSSVGVDLFFVISGFIMVYISGPHRAGDRTAADFLVRRAIRIYPMYLLVTLFLCGSMAAGFVLRLRAGLDPDYPFNLQPYRLLASLVLFPSFNEQGYVAPVLGVGWTLSYEVLFYGIFAGVLWCRSRSLLLSVTAALAVCIAYGRLTPLQGAPAQFLANTIVFEFVGGCAIGKLYRDGRLPRWHPAVLIGVAAALFALSFQWPRSETWRFLTWGIPSALVVIAFLEGERRETRMPTMALLIGDASYSIYLVHTLVVARIMRSVTETGPLGSVPTDLLIAVMVAASLVIGAVVYRTIERPCQRRLHALIRPAATRGGPASSLTT